MVRAEKQKRVVNKKKIKESLVGWLFISPLLVGILLFLAFPLGYAVVISFTDTKATTVGMHFVGLENYFNVLNEPLFVLSSKTAPCGQTRTSFW